MSRSIIIIGLGLFFTTSCALDASSSGVAPRGLTEDEAKSIRKDVLDKSNYYRGEHDLDKFAVADELQNIAQTRANDWVRLNTLEKRRSEAYGENTFVISPFRHLGEIVVDMWYMEMYCFFPKDTESNKAKNDLAECFTQLLWRESKEIGIGVAKNKQANLYYIVVDFKMKGNIEGRFEFNEPYCMKIMKKEEFEKYAQIMSSIGEGNTLQSKFGNGEEFPILPGWSSTLYKDVRVPIKIITKDNIEEYARFFKMSASNLELLWSDADGPLPKSV